MVFLSIAIVIALLVTIALPIAAAVWINKRLGVGWMVLMYGAIAYFIVQIFSLLTFSGLLALVENRTLALSDRAFIILQLFLSIVVAVLFGVTIRWLGMRFLKEDLQTVETAFGFGLGYGGIESVIMVGFSLLTTFISMLSNINIDPTSSSLAPEVIAQIEQLWAVPAYIPLSGIVERIATLVMHITVTILILQVFKRKKTIWLLAAIGDELLVTVITTSITELGLGYGWLALASVILAAGNIYLLFRLHAFDLDLTGKKGKESTEIENEVALIDEV